ncbi:tRNA lysidine(34) synthetase TilS [Methylocystis sp. ATCC 49242]|uniref:tRNA lysidine(34) synthetase TilS n=1 Tax=Methylocystis sp. ATCC 49242 TaxID=622637 RepID=UPI0001F87A7E|nr:tRNA lysidine(34) synthetase TilS [Methylocystis sp. ATCC 49242]
MRGKNESDLLALLAPHRSLLLAVSGGPDSVALMLLAAQWPDRRSHDIAVATVDHGLRPEARREAEQVGAWANALGFPHHVLTWQGEKPRTRVQERARTARYALLADCAGRIGAGAIVTAHHADDQAETILFRLTRGSGVAGLAGMTAESRCGGVALLRPLLGLRKAALEEICRRCDHDYFRDPSNIDEHYARARLRKLRPLLAAQGLDDEALLRLGQRAAHADAALNFCAENARERAIVDVDSETARFDAAALRELPPEIVQRLLAGEIARLAPLAPLRLERLERAARRLVAALADGAKLRLTIADLLLDAQGAHVTLRPAPPRRFKQKPRS